MQGVTCHYRDSNRHIHVVPGIHRRLWHSGSVMVGRAEVLAMRCILPLALPVVIGWGEGLGLGGQNCRGRCEGFVLLL